MQNLNYDTLYKFASVKGFLTMRGKFGQGTRLTTAHGLSDTIRSAATYKSLYRQHRPGWEHAAQAQATESRLDEASHSSGMRKQRLASPTIN